MVQLLLRAGADPNRRATGNPWLESDGRTALHFAARVGAMEMMESLLAAGAEADALDDRQRTPLAEAAATGKVAAILRLAEQGANPYLLGDRELDALRVIATRYQIGEVLDWIE